MKLSLVGRWSMALFASLALGLSMTACGGGTIGYMWVLGQQYNQVVGFKVDDYTGNLTEIQGSPFSSNGSVPVSIVVKMGGRYIYVINQGVGGSAAGRGQGQTIALYSVGGDGTITYQLSYQSQGYVSEWAQMDGGGNYLYVLDKYSPGLNTQSGLYDATNTDGNGAITVFSADPNTGRLTLITNSQTLQPNNANTPFWEVGPAPIMSKTLGSCLYTVNSGLVNGTQSVTPFQIGQGGQLLFTTTGTIAIPAPSGPTNITSINGSEAYAFLTDNANNTLYGYNSVGSCNLTALNGGTTANLPGTSNPIYSMIDSTGKYLYVINNSNPSTLSTNPYSSISAFFIIPTNQELQPITGAPYTVGSGPTCVVEDPSNQYIYTSNYTAGTVTGKSINPTTGELSDLSKGSTFPATGMASCLAISGSVE